MDFTELKDLIAIRDYVSNAINNLPIDRATVTEMSGTLILLDRKIIELLKSEDFKEYIGYQGAREAIEDVARRNNVKFTLKK